MAVTREAKYLAPIDIGKTVTVTDAKTGMSVTGELMRIDALECSPIELTVIAGKNSGQYAVGLVDPVTVTGTNTPPGINLHRGVLDQGE